MGHNFGSSDIHTHLKIGKLPPSVRMTFDFHMLREIELTLKINEAEK